MSNFPPETVEQGPQAVEQATAGWRTRLGQIAGRAALAFGIAVGGTVAYAASEPEAAYATGNYGDYLSGKYADQTHCYKDATTIAEEDITTLVSRLNVSVGAESSVNSNEIEVKAGTIELRYSPSCKTKWARMSTTRETSIYRVSITQDTGYKQSRFVGGFVEKTRAATAFSPMIYTPDNRVHAYVEGDNLVNQSTDWK
jgi:hypothetical protein